MNEVNLYASGIISAFHLAGVFSFALSRVDLGESINGIVFIEKGPWNNYLLDEQVIEHPNLTLRLIKYSISASALNTFLSVGFSLMKPLNTHEFIYVCGHSKVNIKLITWLRNNHILHEKKTSKTVVFDEGIGSYGDLVYHLKTTLRQNGFVLSTLLAVFFGYPLIRKLLNSKKFVDINWKLFVRKSNGTFEKNSTALIGYRKVFAHSYSCISHKSPVVLFVSQPLYSLGVIKENVYFLFLQKLSDHYMRSGFELIVKPHPTEDIEKYRNSGITISDYKGTAEELIYKMNVISVIGFGSTTLITASVIFGIPTYSLINLLDNHKSLMDLIEQCQSIKELFKTNVHFVNNFSDLLPIDLRK